MSITLSKLCAEAAGMYNMKLIAGKSGMGNTVRWVHMVEDIEVPEFLHGNELIFTTGIGTIDSERLVSFIKQLKIHSAVGLVLNIGPYIKDVPEEAIELCEREGFPLFTLPWEVYIIDITYDFCRRIIDNEKSETSAAEIFSEIIVNPQRTEEYAPALERLGFKAMNSYRVITAEFRREGRNITEQFYEQNRMKLWTMFAKSQHASVIFVKNARLVTVRQNSGSNIADTMRERLAGLDLSYTIGISDTARGYRSVAELFQKASAAFCAARIRQESIMRYDDLGIYKIILGAPKDILRQYAEEYLSEIERYDEQNNTDYENILRQYLEQDGSVQAVAEMNEVHRNTVNTKIRQIKNIFGLELTNKSKTELMTAFFVKDALKYIE